MITLDLSGKKGLVLGVANKRSIAWCIAKRLHEAGAELAFTYQGERLKGNVQKLLDEHMAKAPLYECDVTSDEHIETLFSSLKKDFGSLDYLVHCIAYAPSEDMKGRFVNTSRKGFGISLEVSAYSLVAVTRQALPMMQDGGSVLTLSFLAAERVFPGYNVMAAAKAALECSVRFLAHDLGPDGIRVNALSAGPIGTLAARSVTGFTYLMETHAERSPLKRNITRDEVADTALFLLSDMASGITGQTILVDAGFSAMGI